MLWPYLAATLVRGSAVTAWVNLATAPIPGRVSVHLPLVGSQVGTDGVIVELVNEQLDPGMVPRAEAALAGGPGAQPCGAGLSRGHARDRR